jgi:hypothetical protein
VLLPLPPFMVATVMIMPHPDGLARSPRKANQQTKRYRIRGKLPIAVRADSGCG